MGVNLPHFLLYFKVLLKTSLHILYSQLLRSLKGECKFLVSFSLVSLKLFSPQVLVLLFCEFTALDGEFLAVGKKVALKGSGRFV